jgi:hypothetical protein
MSIKALVFAIIGALVAAFYGLESVLSYQANGFTAPMLVKVAICAAGAYFFLRNAARVRKSSSDAPPANVA